MDAALGDAAEKCSCSPHPRRASMLWKNMSFLGGRRVEKGRVTRRFRVVYFAHFRFLNTPASGKLEPACARRSVSFGLLRGEKLRDLTRLAPHGCCWWLRVQFPTGSLRCRQSCYRLPSGASQPRVIDSRGMCPAHIALRNGSNLKKGSCC